MPDIAAVAAWFDQSQQDCLKSLARAKGRKYAAYRADCYRLARLFAMLGWVTRVGWCIPLMDEPRESIKELDWRIKR